jgi:hypothetical protein
MRGGRRDVGGAAVAEHRNNRGHGEKCQAPTGTTVAQEPEPRLETVKQLPEPDGQA